MKDTRKKREQNNGSIAVSVFSYLMNPRCVHSGFGGCICRLCLSMSEMYSGSEKEQRRQLDEVTFVVAQLKYKRRC